MQSTRKRRYDVFLTFEDGWYVADVPALPGCMSQGRTEQEAIANAGEAIAGYLAVLREQGREIPRAKVVRLAAAG